LKRGYSILSLLATRRGKLPPLALDAAAHAAAAEHGTAGRNDGLDACLNSVGLERYNSM